MLCTYCSLPQFIFKRFLRHQWWCNGMHPHTHTHTKLRGIWAKAKKKKKTKKSNQKEKIYLCMCNVRSYRSDQENKRICAYDGTIIAHWPHTYICKWRSFIYTSKALYTKKNNLIHYVLVSKVNEKREEVKKKSLKNIIYGSFLKVQTRSAQLRYRSSASFETCCIIFSTRSLAVYDVCVFLLL